MHEEYKMKKIIVNSSDLSRLLVFDSLDAIVQQVECPAKDCSGYISFTTKQQFDGSVAICNKCKRGIILKEGWC